MLVTEIIVTVIITGCFGYIGKKLEKLEEKVDLVENDLIKLSVAIEKRAEVRRRSETDS
jgi:hypothetical protein